MRPSQAGTPLKHRADRRPLLSLFLWVCLGAWSVAALRPPPPLPPTAPASEFSAGRALRTLGTLAAVPHPLGTAAHDAVREALVSQLSSLGLTPHVQTATALRPLDGLCLCGRVQNVTAVVRGSAHDEALLIVAHYDSVPTGPGASDDGAAVAAMLETARALTAGPRLRHDIVFLFTDGEEEGLLGSEAFVDASPTAHHIGAVLNFEARGDTGPALMFETSPGNGGLIDALARSGGDPRASSLMYEVYKRLPNDTDFSVFKRTGLRGLNFANVGGVSAYHTRLDDPAHADPAALQHKGAQMLGLARRIGNEDWARLAQPDAVYFNVGHALIRYPAAWAMPLAIFTALLVVGTVILGFRARQVRFRGLTGGVLAFPLIVGLTGAVIGLLWQGLVRLDAPYHIMPMGDTYNAAWDEAAFCALALAGGTGLSFAVGRLVSDDALALGALLWWLALTVGTSVALPGASYLFLWPLLFSTAGQACRFALLVKAPEGAVPASAPGLGSVPAVVLLAPLIVLLFQALTISQSVVVIVIEALLLGLLFPTLARLSPRGRRVLVGLSALAGLTLLAVGWRTAHFDAAHPRPTSVLYSLDADTGRAVWSTRSGLSNPWTRQFFSGPRQARSSAPVFPLSPPTVRVLGDTVQGRDRTLRLQITSPRHAPTLMISPTPLTAIESLTVDGKPLPTDISRSDWFLRCYGVPSNGLTLTVRLPTIALLTLRVTDQTDALPNIPAPPWRPQPADVMVSPYPSGDRTSVSRTFHPGLETAPSSIGSGRVH